MQDEINQGLIISNTIGKGKVSGFVENINMNVNNIIDNERAKKM